MTEAPRTPGELVFEKYLNSQHIPFEFEKDHPGKSKKPDYTIEWEDRPIVFDVKDFDPPDEPLKGFGQFDPYPPIREKIDQGRKKFKEYKEYCCGLVLFDAGRPLVFLDTPMTILGSMYGDSGFTFPFNTETGVGDASQTKQAFLGRGKMIRPNWTKAQNTTLSAIITVSIIKPFMMQMADLIAEDRTRDWETELREKIPGFDPNLEAPRVIVWHRRSWKTLGIERAVAVSASENRMAHLHDATSSFLGIIAVVAKGGEAGKLTTSTAIVRARCQTARLSVSNAIMGRKLLACTDAEFTHSPVAKNPSVVPFHGGVFLCTDQPQTDSIRSRNVAPSSPR